MSSQGRQPPPGPPPMSGRQPPPGAPGGFGRGPPGPRPMPLAPGNSFAPNSRRPPPGAPPSNPNLVRRPPPRAALQRAPPSAAPPEHLLKQANPPLNQLRAGPPGRGPPGSGPPPPRGSGPVPPPRGPRPPGGARSPLPPRGPPPGAANRPLPGGPPPRGARPALPAAKEEPKQDLSATIPQAPSRPAPTAVEVAPAPPVQPRKKMRRPPIPGRLTVTMIRGEEIMRHDKGPGAKQKKTDPYFKFELGFGDNPLKTKSPAVKNQGPEPDFEGMSVHLDMVNPMPLVRNNDLVLRFSVWDDNTFSDDMLGEGSVSVLDFLDGQPHTVMVPLRAKTKRGFDVEAGRVELTFQFQVARRGILVLTCFEGIGLRNMELVGKQDPYCVFELGGQKVRTATIENGGRDPYFNEEEVELWVDSHAWTQNLQFNVYDEDVGRDDFIGGADFSILPFLGDGARREVMITLAAGKKEAGKVRLGVQFFPCGVLTVRIVEGRGLRDADALGRQDPYAVFTLQGECRSFQKKTKVHDDGGTTPVWDETFSFDVVDHHNLQLEVFDKDLINADDLIGRTNISLLSVFKRGFKDGWVPIKVQSKWGKEELAGEIKLMVDFKGPSGVAYPQRRPDIDSFDDSNRKLRPAEEAARAAQVQSTGRRPSNVSVDDIDDSFTDKEVEDAFRFIDLDKNMFIGAAEIRHILICMGELITDEEVDEMIRMVDTDGDGQVSFDEFYRLAKHPDPARPDFGREDMQGTMKGAPKALGEVPDAFFAGGAPPPPAPGDPSDAEAAANSNAAARARADEMKMRAQRKDLLKRFAEDNAVHLPELQRALKKFQNLDTYADGSDFVDFDQLVQLFNAEPTGETRKLFQAFAETGGGVHDGLVNVRTFLLGLNNFSGADKLQKTHFAFHLFDVDRSGQIDENELIAILKANHLASDETSVQRKARTILKQADKDGDGEVSLEEFVVIAQKFPNILFPAFAQ